MGNNYLDQIDPSTLENRLVRLERLVAELRGGGSTLTGVQNLAEISQELGTIQEGRLLFGVGTVDHLETGYEDEVPDDPFTGVWMGSPGFDTGSGNFSMMGLNGGSLQFGIDSGSGVIVAGGGVVRLDEDGVTIRASTGASANPGGVTNKNSLSFTDSDGTVVESDVIPADYAGGKRIWVRCGYDTWNLYAGAELKAITELGEITAGVQLWDGGNRFVIQSTSANATLQFYMEGKITGTNPPGCRVYRNSTQAITANQYNSLAWNTELHDTDECWASGDPTKLYAKTAGYYMAGGGFAVACTAHLTVLLNGSTYLAMNGQMTASRFDITTGMFYMNANDYIQIQVYPSANVTIAAAGSTTQYANHGWLARIA